MVYYFWGDDTHAAEREIRALARNDNAAICWVDQDVLGRAPFASLLDQSSGGLFGKELVVVKDPSSMAKDQQKRIADAALAASEGSRCVLWDRDVPNKKTSVVYRSLHKSGRYFPVPGQSQLVRWLVSESRSHGVRLDAMAARMLVDRVGMNKWRLENELKKLALAHAVITPRVVEEYAHAEARIEGGVFDMLDAFVQGRSERAITVMNAMLEDGASEVYVLSMLGYQFRTLASIRQGIEAGGNADAIAREFRLHPYVVKKNMPFARGYTVSGLVQAMMRILAIDLAIKRGSVDARTGLYMAVVNL